MGKKRTNRRRSQRLNPLQHPRRQDPNPEDQQQQQQQPQQENETQTEVPSLQTTSLAERSRRRLDSSSESSSSTTSIFTRRTAPSTPSTPKTAVGDVPKRLYSIKETSMTERTEMPSDSGHQEPGEVEALHYYAGLVSQPRLLARTGTDPWPPAPPPFSPEERETYGNSLVPPPWSAHTLQKRLGPIDGPFHEGDAHPLIKAWPEIEGLVLSALGSSTLQNVKTLIYPTRITSNWVARHHQRRHENCETSQVTVLLGVSETELQQSALSHKLTVSAAAMEAVQQCKKILEDKGFPDVHVEAYETEIYTLSGTPETIITEHDSSGGSGSSVEAKAKKRTSQEVEAVKSHFHNLEDMADTTASRTFGAFIRNGQVCDSIVSIPMRFLNYPGQMLERTLPADKKPPRNSESPESQNAHLECYRQTGTAGSLGLYIALGIKPKEPKTDRREARTDKVLALTSRHVAIGPDMDPNLGYRYQPSADDSKDSKDSKDGRTLPKRRMILWGERQSLMNAAKDLDESGADMLSTAQHAMKSFGQLDEEEAELVDAAFPFVSTNLKRLHEAMLSAATCSYGSIDVNDKDDDEGSDSPETTRKRREVGHVLASAPLGTTDRHSWADWALIELNTFAANSVLARPRGIANKIFVGPAKGVSLLDHIARYHPRSRDITRRLVDLDGFLRIKGTRLPGTLNLQTHDPKDPKGPQNENVPLEGTSDIKGKAKVEADTRHTPSQSEFVIKRGAKTGVTLGLTNEVEAVVRMPFKNSKHTLAYHLLIYPTDTASTADLPNDQLKEMFAAPGDSGSAVVGLDGCVVAMIDAGAGRSDLGRIYQRPPSSLPTAQEQDKVDAMAAAAFEAAKQNVPPPPGYLPATGSAIPGQGSLTGPDMDITLATPIDWVLENIEATMGQPAHLL